MVEQANQNYQKYVEDHSEQLVAMTAKFVLAYKAGRDDEARALYPMARMHWERIDTVAESFGDLDPKIDLRLHAPRTTNHSAKPNVWRTPKIL